MAGENLDNHTDVKNVLVEMGTYFQVQVTTNCNTRFPFVNLTAKIGGTTESKIVKLGTFDVG